MREFEDWEATPNKTYNSLKLFVHGAYARQLVAVQSRTTGQQGYVANQHNHNMYALVTDDDGSVATITQQTAANVTTGSTLGNMYAALMPRPILLHLQMITLQRPRRLTNFPPIKWRCGCTCKLVVVRQCPAHACCKFSSFVQPTPHSASVSTASSTSIDLCTTHLSIEHSCPISQQRFQSGLRWVW